MLFSASKLFDRLASARKNFLGNSFSRQHRSSRSTYLRQFALSVEPLETRHLLSVVGLGITLFEDDGGGNVGGEIAGGNIEAGESFYAIITVEDLRDSFTSEGITSLTIDVEWDESFIEEIDPQASFDNLTVFVNLVTTNFPEDRGATLNQIEGRIENLTGKYTPGSGDGSKIGAGDAEEFSLLHFRAFSELGSSDILISNSGVSFADGDPGGDPNSYFASATASVNVVTVDVNDPPAAEGSMTVDTLEDTAVVIDLRDHVSDTETDDDDLSFDLTDNAGGQAVLENDGYTVTFTPTVNFNGTAAFSFEVTDTASDPQTPQTVAMSIDVQVAAVNDPPRSEETANIQTQEDTPVTIDLRTRVYDLETADDQLAFSLSDDAGGQADLQDDGHTVIFTPAADYNGTTSFSFEVTDTGDGASAAQTVEKTVGMEVAPQNDPPAAEDTSTVTMQEDTAIEIDLWDRAGDLETPDDEMTFVISDGADGQAVMKTDGHTVLFTPAPDFNGQVAFKFIAFDTATPPQNPNHVELSVNVDVEAVNDAPTAVGDTAVTNAVTAFDTDTSAFNHGLLENDSDVDNATLTVTPFDGTSAAGAAVSVGSDGSYTYDPTGVAAFASLAAGQSLDDTFSYTLNDPHGETSTATVTITVYAAATQAVAKDDTAQTDEDSTVGGNVLANDQIASAGLTLSIIDFGTTSTKGATVTVNSDGDFIYDPTDAAALQSLAVDESTTDTFYYTIEDGDGNTDTAEVTIEITGVNDAPTAVDDTKSFDADKISVGNVLGNDSNDTDPDSNDVLSAVEETGTTVRGAIFIMTANGSFQYNPTVSGELTELSSGQVADSFQYTINDGHGGTSTATVNITVNLVNDAPTAADDEAATDGDSTASGNVLSNDSDVDTGDSIRVSAFSSTSTLGATVTVNEDGSFTYDPGTSTIIKELAPGETIEDTFTYTAMDNGGRISTPATTVTVTVTGVDDAPTAGDDSGATDEDTATDGNLFTNDTDHDPGDSFSLTTFDATSDKGAIVTVDTNGDYTYDPSGAAELQTLAHGETTTDTFTYTIEDEQGNTTVGEVTITISGVNDESTAVHDTAWTNKDVSVVGNVLDNDTDPDINDTLVVTTSDTTSAKGAAVTVNSDGSFTYDPTPSATLQALTPGTETTDTFTYTMDDGHGNTQTATVTVTVSGDEGVPVANDDIGTTDENTSLSGNVLDNDQAPVGRTLTVTDYDTSSAHGAKITMQNDGSFTYDPVDSDTLDALGTNQSLNDTFAYTIDDGQGHTATVTITVTGVDDAPVISKNTGENVAAGETVTIANDSLRTTDPDSATADLVYTLTAIPSHGTLKRIGSVLSVGDTFTQADVDNERIKYTHNGNTAAADNFKFTVADGTTTLDVATFNLNLARNTLGGFVYVDSDDDGAKDAGEIGLGSVAVTLTGLDEWGGAVARSTWTDADGSYTFEDIPDGTYEVAVLQPKNFVGGKAAAGTASGTVAHTRISGISLGSLENATGYNFGQEGLQLHMISRRLFLASTPPRNIVYQEAVGSQKSALPPQTDATLTVEENTVTVTGTDGDDSIEFHAGAVQHTLVVNGQNHYYNAADIATFNFNSGAGTDFVTIYGSDADETAHLRPGSATFTTQGLTVNVTEAERILIDAAAGDDEATLYDSPGDDRLRADGLFAMFSGEDFVNWAFNFNKAAAKSSQGEDTSDVGTLTDLVLSEEGF